MMNPFQIILGFGIPLDMNHVDTDMIIPARFLTNTQRNGYGEHLFEQLRQQDSNFIFNDLRYQSNQILITRQNFGCGSSREHAVWALQEAGIKVIIAESYSDIFYNNAAQNGLLLITLSAFLIDKLIKQSSSKNGILLTIDLQQQEILTPEGEKIYFEYDPFRKSCLLNGQDDLDYLLEAIQ